MINLNDQRVRFVIGVILAGIGILLITLIPYGIVAFVALIGVGYYLLKRNTNNS